MLRLALLLLLFASAIAPEPIHAQDAQATQIGTNHARSTARTALGARARKHRWMPIVRLIYRQVRVDGVVWPGWGAEALFPVALVGHGWSIVRFGPVFGSGIDLATEIAEVGSRSRHVDIHGALGLALRVGRPRKDRALLTTLTWRPALRRSGGNGYEGPAQRVSAARGRFELGAVFGHFGFGAFVGLARWSGEREREMGVYLGLSW